jgi:DNA invertase Pin-like site-specific DNA recombinase
MEQSAVRKVIRIPAKTRSEIYNLSGAQELLRVAFYARVSTDNREQESSLENQQKHFEDLLIKHQEWQSAGLYTDDGISGKFVKNRKSFLRMIVDAKAGKIDKIITKSISRFARNNMLCRQYVMELKEIGISVFFEKENLDTMSAGSDLVLSILASIAEQESRDISTNVKWTYEKKFEKGEVVLNASRFLGYSKDEEGKLIIVPEEAEIVRRIYREFAGGYTYNVIARGLERDGILSPGKFENDNNSCSGEIWHPSTVKSILENEKYKGDALLQKTFNVDFLSKRQKNIGQVDSVFVENCIPAIISKELADMVKVELERRKRIRNSSNESGRGKYCSKYPFSGLLICNECFSKFRRHAQWSGDKKTPVWVCCKHQKTKGKDCKSLPIKESVLEQAFMDCIRRLGEDKETLIKQLTQNIEESLCTANTEAKEDIDLKIRALQDKMLELVRKLKTGEITVAIYNEEIIKLENSMQCYQKQKEAMTSHEEKLGEYQSRMKYMKTYLDKAFNFQEFDGFLLTNTVEQIMVINKHRIVFEFKCGFEYEMEI